MFPWYFLSPYRSQWDADIINGPWMDQLEMYIKVYAEEIHPAKPDEFAKYGLTNPGATLTVRYADDTGTEKASYTLLIGDQVPDSENYYAKLEGMDAVLILSRFRVEAMCKIDIFSTTYKPLMYPGINVLSKITATAGDVKIVFTHEKSGDKDVYAINGVVIEGSEAFAWAQKMLTLRSSAYNPVDTPQGEPILVIEAEPLNPDVNKPMTVRVFRDGSGNDIIEKLGYCDCAIDSRLIDEFINYMKGLQGGN